MVNPCAVDAAGAKHLEVSLEAGAPGRVGARDGQYGLHEADGRIRIRCVHLGSARIRRFDS